MLLFETSITSKKLCSRLAHSTMATGGASKKARAVPSGPRVPQLRTFTLIDGPQPTGALESRARMPAHSALNRSSLRVFAKCSSHSATDSASPARSIGQTIQASVASYNSPAKLRRRRCDPQQPDPLQSIRLDQTASN